MKFENLKLSMNRQTYRKHKKDFEIEDQRKDRLFESINKMIKENFHRFDLEVDEWEDRFDEIYNGFATVVEKSQDSISLKLDNNKTVKNISMFIDILKSIKELDTFDLILGCKNNRWWIVDVVSIGSLVSSNLGTNKPSTSLMHLTVNPEIFKCDSLSKLH